jgi:hypothetical protein
MWLHARAPTSQAVAVKKVTRGQQWPATTKWLHAFAPSHCAAGSVTSSLFSFIFSYFLFLDLLLLGQSVGMLPALAPMRLVPDVTSQQVQQVQSAPPCLPLKCAMMRNGGEVGCKEGATFEPIVCVCSHKFGLCTPLIKGRPSIIADV